MTTNKNSKKKIIIIGGARPNFMKIAPIYHDLKGKKIPFCLINTNQHFDENMSTRFFREFKISPHYTFEPSISSPIGQTTAMLTEFERIFTKEKPAIIVVVGDVNSTLNAALAAYKMKIPLAHVEAGLRSGNREMPEEINRLLVDQLSDLLFVTENEGLTNLKKENIVGRVYFVGNIMIDTLSQFAKEVGPAKEEFIFCTMHRSENVDKKSIFAGMLDAMEIISKNHKIYLPLHPRTKKMATEFGLMDRMTQIFSLLEPLNYKDTVYYLKNAKLVMTDSGGIQEETSFLGTPCITLRNETERPVTVHLGTNVIGGNKKETILDAYKKQDFKRKKVSIPLWDGKTAHRIVKVITNFIK